MVLKPLGVGTQNGRALRCLVILDIYVTFPCALAAQRVVVILDESVDEIDSSDGILHPFDVELIPDLEITCLIVLDKQSQGTFLDIVLGTGGCQLELFTYFFDGRSVHAVYLPGNLNDIAVGILCNLGVQTVCNGSLIGLILDGCIVFLHLIACNALVEVTGRQYNYITVGAG